MAVALTDDHVSLFREQGYLVLEGVLDDDDLAPLWSEYSDLLDEVARSRANPDMELRDADQWAALWSRARHRIVSGEHSGPVFEQARWEEKPVNPGQKQSDKKPRGTVNEL